jgi:hypothetical protein
MARFSTTLRLGSVDRHALATLQARYQFSTPSETVGFALRALLQAPEHDYGKKGDEATIRAEVRASTLLEVQADQTELTSIRTELARTTEDLQNDDAQQRRTQRHVAAGGRGLLVSELSLWYAEVQVTAFQLCVDAVDLRAQAGILRKQGEERRARGTISRTTPVGR